MLLASVAVVLGGAGLIVALTRPMGSDIQSIPASFTSPTYPPDQSAAAHKQLRDAYVFAARAIRIDTNGDNPALAGLATVNGAALLEQVVIAAPALPPEDRAAALALAAAYGRTQATSSWVQQRDDPAWRSVTDEVNAKDGAMKKLCLNS
ncbi:MULTISPECIES: hypothetical protein [unclassified Mycobacterium]|uniref:hypothetical protein n=1 Tax=unclassified Mycobacterium TaxID=2642494 RepID=UPI001E659A70|nr:MULTISPECIES: hypothetical protein [unclassified Mycobacterium]